MLNDDIFALETSVCIKVSYNGFWFYFKDAPMITVEIWWYCFSGKKRGRPKKSETLARNMTKEQENLLLETENGGEFKLGLEPDQTNSAAQGLLELSNTG